MFCHWCHMVSDRGGGVRAAVKDRRDRAVGRWSRRVRSESSSCVCAALSPGTHWRRRLQGLHLLTSPLCIVYTDGPMFYLCWLFMCLFLLFLLALRSQNQRMDSSWVCYKQLVVWRNFNLRNCILCLAPYLWGDGKIVPKIWWCPHLASFRNQMAH